jgi:hypothetical protein
MYAGYLHGARDFMSVLKSFFSDPAISSSDKQSVYNILSALRGADGTQSTGVKQRTTVPIRVLALGAWGKNGWSGYVIPPIPDESLAAGDGHWNAHTRSAIAALKALGLIAAPSAPKPVPAQGITGLHFYT